MPDPAVTPASQGPTAVERALVRWGRAVLCTVYGGVALLGLLHLDPRTTLIVTPFMCILVMGLRSSVHQALHATAATPSVGPLLPAAAVGALFAPFGTGVQQLGERGAYLFLAVLALTTALGCHWLYRAGIPAAEAADARSAAAPAAPAAPTAEATQLSRELVRQLALDHLVEEWRRSDELVHRASPADRGAAVEWRGLLLEELERRDPRGFSDWVLDGTARGPEHHLRAGSGGAPTGPEDPAR